MCTSPCFFLNYAAKISISPLLEPVKEASTRKTKCMEVEGPQGDMLAHLYGCGLLFVNVLLHVSVVKSIHKAREQGQGIHKAREYIRQGTHKARERDVV